MIVPTPDFDPLFADDGVPFRDKMLTYIEREFADLLDSRHLPPATQWRLAEVTRSAPQIEPQPARRNVA